MSGVEVVPCVCRTCQDIVSIQRVWNPLDASGEPSPSEDHIRSVEQSLGVPWDSPLVCPDCGGAMQVLLGENVGFGTPVIVEPCPRCGQVLTEAPGGFGITWDRPKAASAATDRTRSLRVHDLGRRVSCIGREVLR